MTQRDDAPWVRYTIPCDSAEDAKKKLADIVDHTDAKNGYDLHCVGFDTPDKVLMVAVTGCGPDSAKNADFILAARVSDRAAPFVSAPDLTDEEIDRLTKLPHGPLTHVPSVNERLRSALKDLLDQVNSLRGYELTTDVTHYKAESNWQDAVDRACDALRDAPVATTPNTTELTEDGAMMIRNAARYRWWQKEGGPWLDREDDGLAGIAYDCQIPLEIIDKATPGELMDAIADCCMAQERDDERGQG